MTGRFLGKYDMASAKHTLDVFNSRKKRGEIDWTNAQREMLVVCGCGAPGCIFVHIQRSSYDYSSRSPSR